MTENRFRMPDNPKLSYTEEELQSLDAQKASEPKKEIPGVQKEYDALAERIRSFLESEDSTNGEMLKTLQEEVQQSIWELMLSYNQRMDTFGFRAHNRLIELRQRLKSEYVVKNISDHETDVLKEVADLLDKGEESEKRAA